MWLKQFFIETPIDFEKKCKNRIIISGLIAVLGLISILITVVVERLPILYLEAGSRNFNQGFYVGVGGGLLGAGIATIIKNIRYLKKPELKKKQETLETDERNRMIGLRCWAYAGYTMFLLLYVGMLFSGLVSATLLKILLVIAGVFALLLLIFRIILQRCM